MSDFTERLVDGFFRRWFLYLIPVVLCATMGIYSASKMVGEYFSSARLSAAANPYVVRPDIRGTQLNFYETAASGTSRLINEQLQTDAFIDDLASRAGLSDAIANGLITRDVIRAHVWAGAAGDNNLKVSATWGDPNTAYLLVDATTTGYAEYLVSVADADSAEAVDFWTQRRDEAEGEAKTAEANLSTYVATLPPVPVGQDRSTEQTLRIERLNAALDRSLQAAQDAQNSIDEAEFSASQARSDSTRDLRVIDAPERAAAPSPVKRDQITQILMFTVLGILVGLAALVVGTTLDTAVRSRSQLARLTGVTTVSIPRIRRIRPRQPPTPAAAEAA